jgi:hypothetical protein
MPDQRKHRGPHQEDTRIFSDEFLPSLRCATQDFSLLLTRGYAPLSALKFVGDRYALDARQRLAVSRCACGDEERKRRRDHEVSASDIQRAEMWIDGYNVLITVEAALSGGAILVARDNCFRDMASLHGSYRKVQETLPAIRLIGESLKATGVAKCRWLLDQPVSNSGRLKSLLLQVASERDWDWVVELVPNPDGLLSSTAHLVASSDSQILDHASRWFNLARFVVTASVNQAWIRDLSTIIDA